MAFTQYTVTHQFNNADGTPASGQVTFTLTNIMTNGATSYVPAAVTAQLSSSGSLSQSLTSNADTGTVPTDVQWRVDLRVQGAEQLTFFVVIPAGGGSGDLFGLIPGSQQVS